ncbi:ATP-binding protein [Paenibacillus sp. GP183]|uniref:ATP-binding protein n=1 Tax=Paenibacillus sp. GP183 TaxID=1882751 RepID=UPI0008962692|nr:ATP-binding protein [Paenibacillus sp. GP183]SED07126.1 Histidine kinase-, DNA gyrase B-, and HSP90-like ATPase [Paenibacillus sp. GP183]
MREISIPPYAPMLMESTRALGYSLEAAIADILDNSITAKATNISIKFIPFGEPYLSILDNGKGMNSVEITDAMRYGSGNPLETRDLDDLGRFGLGLKTASLSQSRKLTVISLKNGKLSGRSWDLDHVIKSGKWSLLVLDKKDMLKFPQIELLQLQSSGTLVILQNLDRVGNGESDFEAAFSEKMDRVREHLSLVFHRYISGESGLKSIKMNINNEPLAPHDPFLINKSTQIMDDEKISIGDHLILVKPYILPHISKMTDAEIKMLGGKDGLTKQQGFYVYRNKRLLIWGSWFRLIRKDELSKLARVRVDIPNTLDHLWAIDIRKSTATPPEIVRKNLSRIVGQITEGSKRTWTFRGKKETDDSIVHLWTRLKTREGILYDINRDHPLVEMLKEKLDLKDHKFLHQLLKMIEMNIPLNSLYIDLTNDEKFKNNELYELTDDIKELAELLLENCKNPEERQRFFDKIESTPPFSQFPGKIVKYLKEVNHA